MRLAVFTDDPAEADLLCGTFTAAGHTCRHGDSGEERIQLLPHDTELIVLDSHFPQLSSLMASAAQTGSPIPLLLIANRADENAIAAVMAAGANDYLLRPIRRPELLTRVHVLFRRAYPDWSERERIRFGPYTFDMATAHISCAGKPIEVTQKEFELALLFFRNLGRPLSRAYILDMVWSREGNVPSRTMDTHVSRVRSKLQLRPENGYRLTPVYSYGYRLEELQDTA